MAEKNIDEMEIVVSYIQFYVWLSSFCNFLIL